MSSDKMYFIGGLFIGTVIGGTLGVLLAPSSGDETRKKITEGTEEVIVLNTMGLHARPASMFVQAAGKFKSTINVIKDGKTINAKSIMGIMAGGISQGTVIQIQADGLDEQEAVDTLVKLIKDKFVK